MIVVPVQGVGKVEKTKDDIIFIFNMNIVMDLGTPSHLLEAPEEFAGKIQQNCNGELITCSYDLDITAEFSGCICCDVHPTAMIQIEILTPEGISFCINCSSCGIVEGAEYDLNMGALHAALDQTPLNQTPPSQTPPGQTLLDQTPPSQTPLGQTPPAQVPTQNSGTPIEPAPDAQV